MANDKGIDRANHTFASIENAPVGYIILDREGKIIKVNRACREQIGYREEELAGRHIKTIIETLSFFDFSTMTDQLENAAIKMRFKDGKEIDILFNASLWGEYIHCIYVDVTSRDAKARELRELTTNLANALAEISVLRGILPICASCKKIRNDRGEWESVDSYIHSRTGVEFSHGICSECLLTLYPDFYRK